MYQLYLVCIVNSFNMKNNFYIDSMDLFHFEGKKKGIKKDLFGGENCQFL